VWIVLIDTHAHLCDVRFDADLMLVLERARLADVGRIITVSIDVESSRKNLGLATEYPQLSCAVGIYPTQAESFDSVADEIEAMLDCSCVTAVGEIGLDFRHAVAPRATQIRVFRRQVEWAVSRDLPVIVHNRDADEEVMTVLSDLSPRGVLHCFSGDEALVEQASLIGMHMSFAGNVTYKNAVNLHGAAKLVPLERLLVETDAPYLPPQPVRGRRNEPAHVVYTAQRIAELRGMSLNQVVEWTTRNACRLFGREQPDAPA
jgi:TatD DNase family protein